VDLDVGSGIYEPVTFLYVVRELSAIQQCPKIMSCLFFELAHFLVVRLALYVIVILQMVVLLEHADSLCQNIFALFCYSLFCFMLHGLGLLPTVQLRAARYLLALYRILTDRTVFAAGKLPVGLGAAAALAACAVIVDAGGQTVRTPTGREYLPYPRVNPDL